HLDFDIEDGELRVLVGPNGAGKTTLIDLITGRYKPTSGQILFRGQNIGGRARHEIYRIGISRKFQVPTVYDNLTVFENMSIGLRGHRSVFSSLTFRITPAHAAQVERILTQINLLERARDEARVLSHGEKQWLEIGMVVASDPQLLLLDEPTTGMTREENRARSSAFSGGTASGRPHCCAVSSGSPRPDWAKWCTRAKTSRGCG